MKRSVLRIAADMMEQAADEFSNHGCNDMLLDDTPANRSFVIAMHKAIGDPDEEYDIDNDIHDGDIMTTDWLVMQYLAKLFTQQADRK